MIWSISSIDNVGKSNEHKLPEPAKGTWIPSRGGIAIAWLDTATTVPSMLPIALPSLEELVKDDAVNIPNQMTNSEYISALVFKDTRTEVDAIIQLCAALNCDNVETFHVKPSRVRKTINGSKKHRKNKKKLYEYHVLDI